MKAVTKGSTLVKGAILTAEQHQLCSHIATGKGLPSQRAKALLALDQKMFQAEAATKSGLSRGQVKYLATRFRQIGMDIFPESSKKVDSSGIGELSSNSSEPVKAESTPAPPKAEKGKKDKKQKAKKMKKDKKGKKTEKEEKEEKAKAAKKAKKAKKAAKVKKAKAKKVAKAKKAKKVAKAKKAKKVAKAKKAKKAKAKSKKKK